MKTSSREWIGRVLLSIIMVACGTEEAAAQLYHWTNLSGAVYSRPEIVAVGNDAATVFGRGTDGALWYRDWNGASNTWSAWTSLAGQMKHNPAAVSSVVNGQNVTTVFVTGQFDEVWSRTRTGSSWGPWQNLSAQGQVFLTPPGAAALPDGRIAVCGKGATFRIYCKIWNGAQWSGWHDLAGGAGSKVEVVGWDTSKFAVFTSWRTYQVWDAATGWSGWLSTGAVGDNNSFAVTSTAPGRIDVVATLGESGTAGPVHYRWFDGLSWQGFGIGGSGVHSDITSAGAGRFSIFVQSEEAGNADFPLWHRRFDGTTWLPWQELLPRQTNGAPSAAALNDGRTHVVVQGPSCCDLRPVYNYYFP